MNVKGMGGHFSGQVIQVSGSLVFGRNPQGCDVHFPDNTKGVSRTHCKIDTNANGATITDMGSSYGTFLNGRKLAPYAPNALNSGDTFWLGDRSNSFTVEGVASKSSGGAGAAGKKPLIAGIVAAVIALIAIIAIIIKVNSVPDSLLGTWKVAEVPGARMSFAENGDLLITDNGQYLLNGTMTYSPAGDHMVSVKYTAPQGLTTTSGGLDVWIFNIGSDHSQYDAYISGYIWKYKYSRKDGVMVVYDVNGYKLFSLEKAE